MPINRKDKIIFIHIPKCAGTSIAKSLNMSGHWKNTNFNILYGITNDNIILQSLCFEFYNKYLDDKIIDYCKIITVVRNPYCRILSDFTWRNRGYKNIYDYLLFIKNELKNKNKFDLMKVDIKKFINHILPQYEYINNTKYEDKIKILKFENLKNDFQNEFPNKKLLYLNKTSHINYKDYFKTRPECIKLINEIYEKDFIKFNYKMVNEF